MGATIAIGDVLRVTIGAMATGATGTTGTSESEVLIAAIKVSDGGKVEICSLDVIRGSLMESEVCIAVCVTGIERACVQRDLERLGVAWVGLLRYAKVLGSTVLENRSVTLEMSIWSFILVGAVGLAIL